MRLQLKSGMKKRKDFPTFLKYKYYVLSNKFKENFQEFYLEKSLPFSQPVERNQNQIPQCEISQIHSRSQKEADQSKLSIAIMIQGSALQYSAKNCELDLIKESSDKDISSTKSGANKSRTGSKQEQKPQTSLQDSSWQAKGCRKNKEEQEPQESEILSDDSEDKQMLQNRMKGNLSRRRINVKQKQKEKYSLNQPGRQLTMNTSPSSKNESEKKKGGMLGRQLNKKDTLSSLKKSNCASEIEDMGFMRKQENYSNSLNQNIFETNELEMKIEQKKENIQKQEVDTFQGNFEKQLLYSHRFPVQNLDRETIQLENKLKEINFLSNQKIRKKEFEQQPSPWEYSLIQSFPQQKKFEMQFTNELSYKKAEKPLEVEAIQENQCKNKSAEKNATEQKYSSEFDDIYQKGSMGRQSFEPKCRGKQLSLFELLQTKFQKRTGRKWMKERIADKQMRDQDTQTEWEREVIKWKVEEPKDEKVQNEIKGLRSQNEYMKVKLCSIQKNQQKMLQFLTKHTIIIERLEREVIEQRKKMRQGQKEKVLQQKQEKALQIEIQYPVRALQIEER